MIRRVRYKAAIPEARTKQEALQAEADARRAVYEGRYGKQASSTGFEKFVREVFVPYCKANRKNHEQDEQKANLFIQFFKGKTFSEISPMQIEKFKKERRDGITKRNTVRKASSVNQELSVLSRVFNLAIENGYTNVNPVDKVRMIRGIEARERYLGYDEEVRLRRVIEADFPELLPLLDLALNTGMRHREMTNLAVHEVNLQARSITLPAERTKEKKSKTIPLNDVAYNVVSRLVGDADRGRLFDRGYEASWIERRWREACKAAEVLDLRIHDLRHTFATRLSESGVTETAIAALLGHSSIRMTKRYTHATPEATRAAVGNLCLKIVPATAETANLRLHKSAS
jgi:integrase